LKPFFSIIIPAYNAEATLEATLRSVGEQSCTDWELWVVDDGSNDGTVALVEQFSESFPPAQVRWLSQANRGLGAARNAGIQKAQGSYVALLDADDLWTEDKLVQCEKFLRASPECDLLYHQVVSFGLGQERVRQAYPVGSAAQLLERGNPIVPSATLLRRSTALAQPFAEEPEYHGAEDLELWLRLLHQQACLYYWPEVLTRYRETGGMHNRLQEHLEHTLAVIEAGYQKGYYRRITVEKARQRKFYEAGRYCQKRGDHHGASYYFSLADARSVKLTGLKILNALGIRY